MTTTIRLRGPADIITVLPYHLGYRPRDSLVLVSIGGGRLGFVARVDLPPVDLPVDELADAIEQVVGSLIPIVVRESPDEVVLVVFESEPGQGETVGTCLRAALAESGVPVADRFVVRDGRYYSPDCSGSCCPSEGQPVPDDADVPAVAAYVLMGRRPASDRGDLADRIRPQGDAEDDEACAAAMRSLARPRRAGSGRPRRPGERGLGQRGVARAMWACGRVLRPAVDDDHLLAEADVPAEAWAWASVGLLDVQVRDLVAATLCPGTLPLEVFGLHLLRLAAEHLPFVDDDTPVEHRDRIVEQLERLCRRTPQEISPGPLSVLAQVAWWTGDGALARSALDLALEADPTYRLALLLQQMVDHAIRPGRLPPAAGISGVTDVPA